jgi:hypothetical protein
LLFYAIKHTPADGVFVQLEIVRFAAILRNTYDFFRPFVDSDLCFYGVLFLFTGVPLPLFF